MSDRPESTDEPSLDSIRRPQKADEFSSDSSWQPQNTGSGSIPPTRPPSPPPVIRRRKGMGPVGWVLLMSAVFFILFVGISGVLYLYSGSGRRWSPGSGGSGGGAFFSGDSVAVVELNGVIMDSRKTLRKLKAAGEAPDVKAVVLRLNSPGGAVAPSQEIYQAVREFKKPLVVSMSSVAASGAFYVACAAKRVFANPGTITGSIGVIMEFANLQGLYEWAKVQRYSVKTGQFKDIGAEYRPMTPEEHALLQNMVDDVLTQFKQAVSTGRKIRMEEVSAIADGRIFSGSQARSAHLVDELGTLHDAVKEAAREAGISGKPNVVYVEKSRNRLLDLIFSGDSDGDEDSSEASGSFMHSRGSGAGVLQRFLDAVAGTKSFQQAITGLEPGIYWVWGGAL